jgi:putative addiction module component (TIGR02574 family)
MADTAKTLEDLRKLPIDERIQLVEDLWDSIAEDSLEQDCAISPELAAELDRRLAEYEADPGSALPWEIVRDRIRRPPGGGPG